MVRELIGAVCAIVLFAASPARAEGPGETASQRQIIWPHETHGLPPGFHEETQLRWGAIIGGAVTMAVGGLFLAHGFQQRANPASSDEARMPGDGGEFFLVSGGAHLAIGAPILLYGLLSPREVYVRDAVFRVSVAAPGGHQHVDAELKFAF